MEQMEKGGKSYVGYEYKIITVDGSRSSMYLDSYRNFGWEPDENQTGRKETGRETIHLKRDRKILNKAELTRLERHFEDCMNQIEMLERSKYRQGRIAALTTGILGTVFMAGSTFAVTASPPIIWLCVLLAVPGFAGWIVPYFLYRALVRRRQETVEPLLEQKYEEIDKIWEKGSQLLRN